MADPVIVFDNVHKSYRHVKAVDGISFDVAPSTCFGLLGRNGAGKSTIMRLLYRKAERDPKPHGTVSAFGFDPEREVAVFRELSKRFEEIARGSARELAQKFEHEPKGEITLVIGPAAAESEEEEETAVAAVAELIGAGLPRRHAVELVAKLTGVARNKLYGRSL